MVIHFHSDVLSWLWKVQDPSTTIKLLDRNWAFFSWQTLEVKYAYMALTMGIFVHLKLSLDPQHQRLCANLLTDYQYTVWPSVHRHRTLSTCHQRPEPYIAPLRNRPVDILGGDICLDVCFKTFWTKEAGPTGRQWLTHKNN